MTKDTIARHRRSRVPTLVVGFLGLVLVAIGVLVLVFLVSWVRGSMATPGISPGLPGNTQPSENVTYGFGQLLPTWVGTDRVTVLVLGVDERSQESGPWRTDTIMLLTLDPVSRQAGVAIAMDASIRHTSLVTSTIIPVAGLRWRPRPLSTTWASLLTTPYA